MVKPAGRSVADSASWSSRWGGSGVGGGVEVAVGDWGGRDVPVGEAVELTGGGASLEGVGFSLLEHAQVTRAQKRMESRAGREQSWRGRKRVLF